MTCATRCLMLAAAALWIGTAAGSALSPGDAPWLALAASLAAWCAARARGSASGWALTGILLVGAALGALAARATEPIRAGEELEGRWIDTRPLRGGTVLVLGARTGTRVWIPRTGQEWLDRFPAGAGPGARIAVPLHAGASSGHPRALSASAIRVVQEAGWIGLFPRLAAEARAAFLSRAARRLLEADEDPVGGLLLAMVAGEREAIPPSDWRALRASGLAHQAVVSGVQVGIIVIAAAWVLSPLGGTHGRGRRLVALAAAAAALLLLPADPPVRRAGLAVLVARAGCLAGRGACPASALAGAVFLLLAADPPLAVSVSLALTVAATAALVTGTRHGGHLLHPRTFLAPILATWPVLVRLTDRTGPWSPIANLVADPAAVPALIGGWLAVLVPTEGPVLEVLRTLARAAAWWFLAVAREVALWPGSGQVAAPAGIAWVAVHEVLVFAWLLARGRRALAFATLAALSFLWPLRPTVPTPPPRGQLEVLDVGQGQAVLLRSSDRVVLYDAADDQARDGLRALVRRLRDRYIRRLDALVLSQNDRDHAGGALELLAATPPRRILVGENLLDDPVLAPLFAEAARRGIPVSALSAGDRPAIGRIALSICYPPAGRRDRDNESSLVVHATGPGLDVLLAGDAGQRAEREMIARWSLRRAGILVAGHHGSKGSTGNDLLDRLDSRLVLISAGRGNRYGHPHRETLDRLAAHRVPWLLTARDGDLTVMPARRGWEVVSAAGGSPVWFRAPKRGRAEPE